MGRPRVRVSARHWGLGLAWTGLVGLAVLFDGRTGVVEAGVWFAVAIPLAVVFGVGRLRPAPASLGLGVPLCLAALMAHASMASVPGEARQAGVAVGVCLAWCLAAAMAPRPVQHAMRAGLLALGTGVALWAIRGGDFGAAAAPFGNPARLAAFLLLPSALALSAWRRAVRAGAPRLARNLGVLVGTQALAVLATGSRAGGLALLVGIAIACWPDRVGSRRIHWPRSLPAWTAGAFALAAAATLALPVLAPGWFPWAGPAGESSVGIRWQLNAVGVRGLVDAWPVGVGLGGYRDAFLAMRPDTLAYAPRHAHHEPLQLLWEFGAAGALLLLALGVAIVRALRVGTVWAASTATAAATLWIFACFDSPLRVFALAFPAACVLGVGLRSLGPEVSGVWVRAAGVLLAAWVVVEAGSQFAFAQAMARADHALQRGAFAEAAAASRDARKLRPRSVDAWRQRAEIAEAKLVLGGGDGSIRRAAREARDRACAWAPARAVTFAERARLHWRLGDEAGARADLDRAILRDPVSPALRFERAALAWQRGDRETALADLARGIDVRPESVADVVTRFDRLGVPGETWQSMLPRRPKVHAAAGLALERAGHYAAAASIYESGARLAPERPQLAFAAARGWRVAGETSRAEAVLRQAERRWPEHAGLAVERERLAQGGEG